MSIINYYNYLCTLPHWKEEAATLGWLIAYAKTEADLLELTKTTVKLIADFKLPEPPAEVYKNGI